MNGDANTETPERMLTDEDHDRGYKDLPVQYRSGRKDNWRIAALNYRDAQAAMIQMIEDRDSMVIVEKCLSSVLGGRKALDRLTVASAGEVEAVALALCFGEEFKKKLYEVAGRKMQTLITPPDAPKSTLSDGATESASSAPGRSPS